MYRYINAPRSIVSHDEGGGVDGWQTVDGIEKSATVDSKTVSASVGRCITTLCFLCRNISTVISAVLVSRERGAQTSRFCLVKKINKLVFTASDSNRA